MSNQSFFTDKTYARGDEAYVAAAVALDSAQQAAADAQEALTQIQQFDPDGITTTYFQTDAPTSGMSNGDMWIDSDAGNRLYRYVDKYGTISHTNLVPYPNGNYGIQGWACSRATIAYDNTVLLDGQYSLRAIVNDTASAVGGLAQRFNMTIDVTAGTTYTMSGSMRSTLASAITDYNCQIVWMDSTNTMISFLTGTAATATAADAWVRLSLTATAPAGAVKAVLNYGAWTASQIQVSDAFFLNGVMVETGSTLNPAIAGGMDGVKWDGTPGASTSTYTPGWIDVQDQSIAQALLDAAGAQATADGKIRTFAQTSAPTMTNGENVGDLWMDTDDNNKMYRWSGTAWVPLADPRVESSLQGVVTEYAVNSSETVAPTSGWSTATPTRTPGTFTWYRITVTHNDGTTATTNPALLTGNTGAPGTPAAVISLTATAQVLAVPAGGGATTPATATVTGVATNTTITNWTYSVDGAAFSATVPAGVSRTTNTVTVTGATMTARTIAIKADNGTIGDTLTVAKVSDGATGATGGTGTAGADGYTVLLTNEAQVFPGSTNAALAGSATSSVVAYKGGTQIAATIGTITGQVTGLTTAITNNGTNSPVITVTVTTALVTQNGTLTVPITVDGKSFTKTFAWAVSYQGSQGIPGTPGADGVTYYTWLKYADTPTTGMSDSPTGKTYMGLAMNKTSATESNVYSDYTWSLIKGADGVPGTPGADGTTTYTWVKYATSATGAGLNDSPTGMTYIGLAFNKTTATESTVATDYQWSLIQGPAGTNGTNGVSITSVTPYFQQVTTGAAAPAQPAVSPPLAPWTTTEPAYTANTELYRTERILFSNATFSYTTVTKVSSYAAAAQNAADIGALQTNYTNLSGKVDGKAVIWYQATAPTGLTAADQGDMWINTSTTNRVTQIWSGSAWQDITDQKTLDTLATVTGKITTFFSASSVVPSATAVGDLWIVTDEGNRMKRASALGTGSWTYVDNTGFLNTQNLVTSWQKTGKTTIDGGNLETDSVTAAAVQAGAITAEKLAALLLLASKIASAEAGRRWEADSAGIRVYGADGSLLVNLPTDTDTPASFNGDLLASSLTVVDQFSLRGQNNQISRDSMLVMAANVTAPSSPPTVVVGWDTQAHDNASVGGIYRVGLACDATYWYSVTRESLAGAPVQLVLRRWNKSTGLQDTSYGFNVSSGASWYADAGCLTIMGTTAIVLTRTSTSSTFGYWQMDMTTGVTSNNWSWTPSATIKSGWHPVLGNDGTNLAIGYVRSSDSSFRVDMSRPSDGVIVSSLTSTSTPESQLSGVLFGSFDYGSARVMYAQEGTASSPSYLKSCTLSGTALTRVTAEDAQMGTLGSIAHGVCWDGTRFVSMYHETLRFYTSNMVKTGSLSWYAANTWYDNDATGGTHETNLGPAKNFTMLQRAKITITTAPIPPRPVPTTTDDAIATRIYISRGSALNNKMERQADPATGVTTASITNVVIPDAVDNAVNQPPTTNGFLAVSANPGQITAADPSRFTIKGDGSGNWGGATVNTGNVMRLQKTVTTETPLLLITSATNGSISTSTWTDLTWSAASVNEDSWTNTGNATFICPRNGTYSVFVQAGFSTAPPASGNAWNVAITTVGTDGTLQGYNHVPFGVNDNRTHVHLVSRLRVGDTVKVQVRPYGFTGSVSTSVCSLRIIRLGGE